MLSQLPFERQMQYWDGVKDANDFTARWSIYDHINSCNEKMPLKAKTRYVLYEGLEVKVEGNTWLDLYRAANEAVEKSGDTHHIFIENFDMTDDGNLELFCGS